MDTINMKNLSKETKISEKEIIKIFRDVGIFKKKDDIITHKEKLLFLKNVKKIFLNTKKEIKPKKKIYRAIDTSKNHKNKTIFYREIRKKTNLFNYDNKNYHLNKKTRTNKKDIENSISNKTELQLNQSAYKEKLKKNKKEKLILEKRFNHIKNKRKNMNQGSIINKNNFKDSKKHSKKFSKNHKKNSTNKKNNIENKNKKLNKTANIELYKSKSLLNIDHLTNEVDLEIIHRSRIKKPKFLKKSKKNKKNLDNKNNQDKKNVIHFSNTLKKNQKNSVLIKEFKTPSTNIKKDIVIGEVITISELSNKMAMKTNLVIKKIEELGIQFESNNQSIDQETAQLIAEEIGHKVSLKKSNYLEELILKNNREKSQAIPRPPIVTVMGHVDHGKTSLLDFIRSKNVTSQEAGGITQHIGAYHVKVNNSKYITFLDTPGHSAFTAMRARGADITDIVILIVASDDGVMPQTIEAIQHAQSAKTPIIVAINKIDKIGSDPEKVRNELIKHNVVDENLGGDTIFVNISSKTGKGIKNLLDAILLQSEMLELKSIPNGRAYGTVLESFIDKGLGPVATVLIQEGKLKVGDIVLCGCTYGRIKVMKNELGEKIKFAKPSIPVQIFGLSNVPISGDKVHVVEKERQAREVALFRKNKKNNEKLSKTKSIKIENIFENLKKEKEKKINLIIKSDVQGSLEAIIAAIKHLSDNNSTKIKIVGNGIGNITETDVSLSIASKSILIGFNVKVESSLKKIIKSEKVDIRCFSIIYDLLNSVELSINGLKKPEKSKKIIGSAIVRNIFKSQKSGTIAGCMVNKGYIKKNNLTRIVRNNSIIYEGEITSLRRFKDDVNEVRNGMECGIGVKNYTDVHVNDIIEVFKK